MGTVIEGELALLASRSDHIMLDLMLPDGDGLDRGAASRVVVTTGSPQRREFAKPIDLVDLHYAIEMIPKCGQRKQ